MQLALLITCLGDVLRPEVGQATVRLLRRLGHSVEFPEAQTCCGQPWFNSGYVELARQQAQHTIGVFERAEAVVTPSGSCAAMVKTEYPRLFEHDPTWRARAEALAARTYELGELLVARLGVLDVGARFDGVLTYHFACHLRMLGLDRHVEQLLEHVAGARVVPLKHEDQCCGFGGSFSVRYPHISTAMVDDKARSIIETEAVAVVSTDTGCLMNIGGRLRRRGSPVRTLHLAQLLDSAST